MLSAVTLGALMALAPQAASSSAGKTLWIVEPLYPGQELLVARSEEALTRLMGGEAGQDQIIGRKALAAFLGDKHPDLSCLTGDAACTDPVDAFVGSLGLSRVVLIKGGQEDASYRFKVTSYAPATGETLSGEGTHANNLERALIAAAVKVVPLASVLEISSTPPGATVFVDGEKVGVTPYQGQILPGERVVKLDLASHLVAEKKIDVSVRGSYKLNEKLEKVPARLVVAALPQGTSIAVDGADWGVDKADKGIQPGRHTIVLQSPGYAALKEEVDIVAGTTFTFERKLEATGWTNLMGAFQRAQDDIYKRKSYFTLSFERGQMWGNALKVKQSLSKSDSETIMGQGLIRGDAAPLTGLSLEYGQTGKYFGIMVVGAAFYRSQATWNFSVTGTQSTNNGYADVNIILLRGIQPQLRIALWRFLFFAQGGPEGRLIMADLKPAIDDASTLYAIDFNITGEVGARLYVVDGVYVEGIFRHSWAIGGRAAIHGFHGGIGYAF
jgi:3D (Asp-Asp-Asp) domain-containing protein